MECRQVKYHLCRGMRHMAVPFAICPEIELHSMHLALKGVRVHENEMTTTLWDVSM